jgi:tRNA G18 (ribose-2'-O)-methylase SpoU
LPLHRIDSIDDPRLAAYRDLRHSTEDARATFIAEGEKLVLRLLESDCETESVVCNEAALARLGDRIPEETPVYVATTPVISQLIGFSFHRGILACGVRPLQQPLEALWPADDHRAPALVVLCPELRDPTNLGSIIRTAAAFGANGVIVGRDGTEPYSRRVLRTSMGTILRLHIIQRDDWDVVLDTLHAAGFESIAAVVDPRACRLSDAPCPNRAAVLLGNEDRGLPEDLVRRCRHHVTLPMTAGVDSLNVAVASGIILNHYARGLTS